MDTPGPFEKATLQAFYNMTLPDPRHSKAEQAKTLTAKDARVEAVIADGLQASTAADASHARTCLPVCIRKLSITR